MRKIEVLSQMFSLNNTILEAGNYILQNIPTSTDTMLVLNDIRDALNTMSASIPLVFNNTKANDLNQQLLHVQRACNTLLKKNDNCTDVFDKSLLAWKNVSETSIYLEAISVVQHCSQADEELAIALLENMLSYSLSPKAKALLEYILCRKLSQKQPLRAYELGIDAFESDNSLCERITQETSHIHNYKYVKVNEVYFNKCPICHIGEGLPYYCAMPLFMINFTSEFSPIKLWMKCPSCGQLYAYNFPQRLAVPAPEEEELGDEIYMSPRTETLPLLGRILKDVLSYATGKKLLEVGAGTGELIAAALEFGCAVEAVEISKRQSHRLRELLSINVHCVNFADYNADHLFNLITMGDVVEHVTDPNAALKKAHELLDTNGILWISTPNYKSAFSRIMKFSDPMWNEPWHITYFESEGFKKLLCRNGFEIIDYTISSRYNGSMEIIARKKAR